jgi:hypothetical protein
MSGKKETAALLLRFVTVICRTKGGIRTERMTSRPSRELMLSFVWNMFRDGWALPSDSRASGSNPGDLV